MVRDTEYNQSAFYDLEQIKEIPILDVCKRMLNLECVNRGGKTWCKTRFETDASTLIHEDKNTFYDFGTHHRGDVIELVSYVQGIERKDAIKQLAGAYEILPIDPHKDMGFYELTLWEYEKIGIAGDKATKNFDFNVERMPIKRIYALSEKYDMTMNALRKKHPKIYEKILRQRALPFVRSLRNEYYLEVWYRYQTMCYVGNPSLFYRRDHIKSFDSQIKVLRQGERFLERAVHGTSIKLRSGRVYDPVKDLEMLSKGEIKPVMGPASYSEMEEASKKRNSMVKYYVTSYDLYAKHMMNTEENLFYSAFLKGGSVVIGYLEDDTARFKPFFDRMRASGFINRRNQVQTVSGRINGKRSGPER